MKIFISEYIILYETFDLNFYEEVNIGIMVFDYINYYESLYNLNNRFMFKISYYPTEIGNNRFVKRKQVANTFFWRRKLKRHDIFSGLVPWYFLPRRWMKIFNLWGSIPMCYKFFQYGYLNELVGNFNVNHKEILLFRAEYPKYDCCLIFNHSQNQFSRRLVYLFEHKRVWYYKRFVFFRLRPYYFEFLNWNIRYYTGAVTLITLNPNCYYFTTGNVITYAKKWVYWTYHVYNSERSRPFVVYGFWTENFFTEVFNYRVVSYRYEFFRDSIALLGPIIGTTEVIQMYIYFFYKTYMYCVHIFFFSIISSLFYSRIKQLKLILLDEHLSNFTWLYSIFFNHIVTVQSIVRQRRMNLLKKEGRKLERKSQLESKLFKIFKNTVYIPLIVIYLENFVNSKIYRNWIEKSFLGSIKDYSSYNNYIFLFLIVINTPFRFFYTFKTAFYKIHIFYYLKLNNVLRHSKLYNARSNYSFNRFFSTNIVHKRELDRYSAFDIIERILNFIHVYSKKEYKDMVNEFITHEYEVRLHTRTRKRKEEYYDYFYFRTFGNYDPEIEFYEVQKSRFFTRLWYYCTDFSFNILTTHQLYMFFNYVHSPLHIRLNSTSVYNFYYILFYSKFYFYYYYYVYFFFFNFINVNIIYIYIHYGFSMFFNLISLINNSLNMTFDGKSRILVKYFWKDYIHVCFIFLKQKYFFIRYIYYFILFIFFSLHYLFTIIITYVRLLILFICSRLFNFFSFFINTDLGIGYPFWHRYYILKFYLIEYNIIYYIFIFIRNFFFNFLLILLIFFILTTIPYVKDFISSDYIIYSFYSFLNKIFIYNKFIYFNEVLDNWWIPYFSPKKFIHFYNGYCNYFEIRLKKLIGKNVIYTAHLGKRKFFYNKFFFDMYFKRYLAYLQWNKFNYLFETVRRLIPGSFPWELYIYMHGYFLLVRHPARHFMFDIYWHTLPIMFTFYWRYKYFLIFSKIFAPLYWFWKYSFSYLVFNLLNYFHDTFFFNFILKFLKNWYNIYFGLNYYFFYFCYYYYFFFFFTVSKIMRYNFITYDFLNYFWVYRSARFIIIIDLFNFFRLCLDSFYFFFIEFFFGFFYFFYKMMNFILNFLGLISFYNYIYFSLSFIPKIHLFISELFDKCITINYDLDEYGRILSKHFRNRTRYRLGDWPKRDMAVRSIYKMVHRTLSFEFKFRQFLFYNKKGLLKNFLIFNRVKVNTFNLFFFSFLSLYFNYLAIIFCFSFFSLTFRSTFKNNSIISSSPFFEWERFTKKNRHLLGRDEFYWLYNIRWLKRFEFYHDKYFSDDLFMHVFEENEVKFGYYLYNQWTKFFVNNEPFLFSTINENRFLLYKRYYLERYMSIIKDIDFIFHEYSISNKKVQNKIFSFYDFFIPKLTKNVEFDFKRDFVKGFGHADLYWFYFATPQLLYTRNWNFFRVMNREELSREFYFKLKKSLFKAYSFYEMNRNIVNYDFFEFQFFEPDFYDDVLYEHVSIHNASERNYFLHKIALSRWSTELIYVTPSKQFFELYAHVGYHDWVDKIEYYFEYLKGLNSRYFNEYIDFNLFGFLDPVHSIVTHLDSDVVKNSIDLSLSDNAVGIKYSELYQYEDLGRVATEQYLFTFLDSAFSVSKEDPSVNIVALTDDPSLSHRPNGTWFVILFLLPITMVCVTMLEYISINQFILPHITIREILLFICYRIFLPETAEILLFHKFLTWEHVEHFYWLNPWIWVKTFTFDLATIEHYSFWSGKHARFLQAKEEYYTVYGIIKHDEFLYDNLSFLWWTFYIDAWRECRDSVIIFILADIFFYLLCILFFLFTFNFSLRLLDLYHYVSKKVHLVLDESFGVDAYKDYEEKKKQEREKKKQQQFDFINLDVFTRFKGNVDSYARKKIKKK